jgi:RNA polymerase sigma factor (sigma-70 family)
MRIRGVEDEYGIVRKKALMCLRTRRRAESRGWPIGNEALTTFPSREEDPAEYVIAEEQLFLVQKALYHLSPIFRQVMILKAVEELSWRQIAAQMNLSIYTVKSVFARALRKLQALVI